MIMANQFSRFKKNVIFFYLSPFFFSRTSKDFRTYGIPPSKKKFFFAVPQTMKQSPLRAHAVLLVILIKLVVSGSPVQVFFFNTHVLYTILHLLLISSQSASFLH